MANAPVVDQFMEMIKPIAAQLGISILVIAARDPVTGEAKLFGAPAAREALRDLVSDKFGFGSEVGWEER